MVLSAPCPPPSLSGLQLPCAFRSQVSSCWEGQKARLCSQPPCWEGCLVLDRAAFQHSLLSGEAG